MTGHMITQHPLLFAPSVTGLLDCLLESFYNIAKYCLFRCMYALNFSTFHYYEVFMNTSEIYNAIYCLSWCFYAISICSVIMVIHQQQQGTSYFLCFYTLNSSIIIGPNRPIIDHCKLLLSFHQLIQSKQPLNSSTQCAFSTCWIGAMTLH